MQKLLAALIVTVLAAAAPASASPFRNCLDRTIVTLDDRITPADAVAAAATEVCYEAIFETRPELRQKPEALDYAVSILKERATAEVLRHRVVTARPQ